MGIGYLYFVIICLIIAFLLLKLHYKAEKELDELEAKGLYKRPPVIPIDPNTPKCPKCGSTAITTGARGVNLTSGMIGASKTVNRCTNCGHTWKPNGR